MLIEETPEEIIANTIRFLKEDPKKNRHTLELLRKIALNGGKPNNQDLDSIGVYLINGILPKSVCEVLLGESEAIKPSSSIDLLDLKPPPIEQKMPPRIQGDVNIKIDFENLSPYTKSILPEIDKFIENVVGVEEYKSFLRNILIICSNEYFQDLWNKPKYINFFKSWATQYKTKSDLTRFKDELEKQLGYSIF